VAPTPRPAVILGDSSRAMLAFTEAMVDTDFDVVASVMDSESLVLAAQRFQPALTLLDFSPSFGDALAATRQLSQLLPATKIVFFSTHDDTAYATAAFEAGASGFLVKQHTSDLTSLLRRILHGERIQHPAELPTHHTRRDPDHKAS
jgi:DNA-binding NarL/FixJ family response regulator